MAAAALQSELSIDCCGSLCRMWPGTLIQDQIDDGATPALIESIDGSDQVNQWH